LLLLLWLLFLSSNWGMRHRCTEDTDWERKRQRERELVICVCVLGILKGLTHTSFNQLRQLSLLDHFSFLSQLFRSQMTVPLWADSPSSSALMIIQKASERQQHRQRERESERESWRWSLKWSSICFGVLWHRLVWSTLGYLTCFCGFYVVQLGWVSVIFLHDLISFFYVCAQLKVRSRLLWVVWFICMLTSCSQMDLYNFRIQQQWLNWPIDQLANWPTCHVSLLRHLRLFGFKIDASKLYYQNNKSITILLA